MTDYSDLKAKAEARVRFQSDPYEIVYAEQVLSLLAENARLQRELTEAQAFKAYVHARLDEAGIPTHPDGPHSLAGCRVGDRLDIALAAEAQLAEMRAALERIAVEDCTSWEDVVELARAALASTPDRGTV